jgi:hypothetical protein
VKRCTKKIRNKAYTARREKEGRAPSTPHLFPLKFCVLTPQKFSFSQEKISINKIKEIKNATYLLRRKANLKRKVEEVQNPLNQKVSLKFFRALILY